MTWANLESPINAPRTEPSSASKDLGDILHEESETMPLDLAIQDAPASSRTLRKRHVPTAGRDEWADSSGDEVSVPVGDEVSVPVNDEEHTTSGYFKSTTSDRMSERQAKKAKMIARGNRYHRISVERQPHPKPLSTTSTLTPHKAQGILC
jgi:hypothetical protein